MLWPAESIIEGTWGSGQPPQEFIDWFLMRHMRWSWDELQATPHYVQRYAFDFLQAQFRHESDQMDAANRRAEQAQTQAGG